MNSRNPARRMRPPDAELTGPVVIDLHPAAADIATVVRTGLAQRPKRLPAWMLYDAEGSRLFEAICEQPEYSLTRTEVALLRRNSPAIAAAIGQPVPVVLEFGAGNARKAEPLLYALQPPAYVALDISRSALETTCRTLQSAHPRCQVMGVCCDYGAAEHLPDDLPWPERRRLGFYPGSSIGNFAPAEAAALLRQFRRLLGPGGLLLIGIDQPKEVARLEAAYNDAAKVSAAFARNLLLRLNRELRGDFDVDAFTYRARWEPEHSRIAMALVSDRAQDVQLAGQRWTFAAGEELITEYSTKYDPDAFLELAATARWQALGRWSDLRNDLSLHLLGPSCAG